MKEEIYGCSAWCIPNGQVITNTFFQLHPRRMYTWQSPDGITRNQIDFITINKRFRNAVTMVKGYPGADCNTDHIILIAVVHTVRLKKINKPQKQSRLDFLRLNDTKMRSKYSDIVSQKISVVRST